MATDITISSLTAVGGLGSIILTATATSPVGMACLPYMQPASVSFYVSSTNNWAAATRLENVPVNLSSAFVVQGGLGDSVTRYYWAVPLDADGNEGARYPAGDGISAKTLTSEPPPNSVGVAQIQNGAVMTEKIFNLAVTNAKIQSLEAGKITAGTITATISIQGPTIIGGTVTGGEVRTAASGNRVTMDSGDNSLSIYNGSNRVFRAGPVPNSTFQGVASILAQNSMAMFVSSIGGVSASARIIKSGNGAGAIISASGSVIGSAAVVGRNEGGGGGGIGQLGMPSAEGGYGVYAQSGGYGPFTGSHDAMVLKDDPAQPGDIVFDKRVIQRRGWGDTLTEVGQTSEAGQRGVVGVVDARFPFDPMGTLASNDAPKDHRTYRQAQTGSVPPPQPGIMRRRWAEKYDRLKINSVGEGQMNVCGRGGDLECGDLICASDLSGKGQRQDDDIVRSWTVAKVREDVSFDHPDQVKIVAVIYLCG